MQTFPQRLPCTRKSSNSNNNGKTKGKNELENKKRPRRNENNAIINAFMRVDQLQFEVTNKFLNNINYAVDSAHFSDSSRVQQNTRTWRCKHKCLNEMQWGEWAAQSSERSKKKKRAENEKKRIQNAKEEWRNKKMHEKHRKLRNYNTLRGHD